MKLPICLTVYNRPHLTRQVFSRIREYQPTQLFVVSDGPKNQADEISLQSIQNILKEVDWPCEVLQNASAQHLGCGRRMASGLSWFFERVNTGIVLEDDCLPDPSFFSFCEWALKAYEGDERVMLVSGTNYLGRWKSESGYHFSKYGGVWGWASWSRAWKHYDFAMQGWEDPLIKSRVRDFFSDDEQFEKRAQIFDKMKSCAPIDTWDYQWHYSRLKRGGLAIVPSVNLIKNIGFASKATHTKNADAPLSRLQVSQLSGLKHKRDPIADDRYDSELFQKFLRNSL